ncbi:MAG: Gfo/Idh/MocA family protein [Candidatus Pelagibacter sp.]
MTNWGIIGLGNMGQNFANSFSEINNSNLIGVASLDKDKIKNFTNKFDYKNINTYNNYDDIINDTNINAIYIATLNNTHFDLIKKCSENNKNILCEKPLTLNYSEAIKVSDYISKNNIIIYEGFAYRSHPQTKIIQEIVNNELGEVINIKSNFGFKVNKVKPESRLFNKKLGGGAILDIGCYPLSLLNFFYKDNSKYKFLNAYGNITETNVEDYAEAEIEIDNKVKCQIKVSFKENYENKTIVEGKKGKLIINEPWLPGNKTTLEISQGNSYYKKLVNSDLSLYANQIGMVSDNFEKNKKDDKFLVNIVDSLSIMKNLSIWSELIKK